MSQDTGMTLEQIVKSGVKLTPMMEQYYNIRRQYPGILLMFRMGDFYEVFFEDAVNASRLLNISLTHRGKLGEHKIPMAGMPHHAAGTYIDRLTGMGLKVAICEQVEDPKEAKGIVKRAVVQVVSPALPYDLEKTEATEHRFITSALKENGYYYLVAIDFTTGEFSGHKLKTTEEFLDKLNSKTTVEEIELQTLWNKGKDKQIIALIAYLQRLGTDLGGK